MSHYRGGWSRCRSCWYDVDRSRFSTRKRDRFALNSRQLLSFLNILSSVAAERVPEKHLPVCFELRMAVVVVVERTVVVVDAACGCDRKPERVTGSFCVADGFFCCWILCCGTLSLDCSCTAATVAIEVVDNDSCAAVGAFD